MSTVDPVDRRAVRAPSEAAFAGVAARAAAGGEAAPELAEVAPQDTGAAGYVARERRLVWLLLARLGLTVLAFAIALGVDGVFDSSTHPPPRTRMGLFWTFSVAFLSAALTGLALRRRERRIADFAAVQLVSDIGIVTALVGFTGGSESVLGFLYALVTLYGALLFDRRGALGVAALSSVAYGGLLLATRDAGAGAGVLLPWAMQSVAVAMVAVLASVLAGELHRTGAELRRSRGDFRRLHDLYRGTVDSIGSGLLTTDSNGRITSLNPEGERITGVAAGEVLGWPLDDLIPGARAIVTSGQGNGVEPLRRARLAHRNREREDLHLGLAGSILCNEDGEPRGHVVIFQDVSMVVAMEDTLRQRERLAAVGEMAAKIAHEIRNPLAAISGSVQLLRSDVAMADDSEPARLMDIVVREADRLSGLIRDFLEYARPRPTAHQSLDPLEALGDVAGMLEASRPANVELRTTVEDGVRVWADPGQLKQLLWNLCLNGLQAMPHGGKLSVEVRRLPAQGQGAPGRSEAEGPDRVEIAVSDTGVGIPADVRERLFEPFFTTKAEGTGLGLALVHRIVEAHQGSLSFESGPSQGTTFRVQLSAERPPAAALEIAEEKEES